MSKGIRVGTANQVVVRCLMVREVYDLSPVLRRVIFVGPDLLGVRMPDGYLLDSMRTTGFDDRLLVILPGPGAQEPVLPIQGRGHIEHRPDGGVGVRRSYTVRRWAPERGELSIDFVLHGHGPAASWAANCAPGDSLHVLGPGVSHGPPEDVDWLLVAGDETALPAIARWLEEMAPDTVADVLIEVDVPEHAPALMHPESVRVTWLYRRGVPAARSTLLLDAMRALPAREGSGFAWVAAEAGVVRAIRSHLREDRGLPRPQVEAAGYWRQGASEDDEDGHDHEGQDHEDHEAEEVTGLARALDERGLLPRGSAVRVRAAGADRIRQELAACRPDLVLEGAGTGVVIFHLDDEQSLGQLQAELDETVRTLQHGEVLLVVVPPEVAGLAVPPGEKGRYALGWLGDVLVLGPEIAR